MSRRCLYPWLLLVGASVGSCALPGGLPWQPAALPGNPLVVRAQNPDEVWERTIDVLHAYHFEILRENKLSGEIETFYLTGASVLEPWHADSVGLENRLESTLQSIRRKVLVRVGPGPEGYVVAFEVLKEVEFVAAGAGDVPAPGTFVTTTPPTQSARTLAAGATAPGWMPRGRDLALEQALSNALAEAFGRG
jgi:hypothetical protein